MKLYYKWLILLMVMAVLALLPMAECAQADQVAIGVLSLDLFQADATGKPTINAFNIGNYTGNPLLGGFALPPFFNVYSFLNFTTTSLTLFGPSAPGSPITIGTIPTGLLQDSMGNPLAALKFPANSLFSSAVLTGTLDVTSVTLFDNTQLLLDPHFSVELLPSDNNLQAGDFAVIYAETASATTPEPGSVPMFLLGAALLAIGALKNSREKFRAKESSIA